jgi:hypothetical protein
MAACTTAPGYSVGWTATRSPSPRAAIARGRRVNPTIYRRRRLAAALLALSVVVVAARAGVALGGSPLAAPERRPASSSVADQPSARVVGGTVVVESGDTLWSIVSALAPGDDPRPLVDELSDARGGAPLQPGERISLPQ